MQRSSVKYLLALLLGVSLLSVPPATAGVRLGGISVGVGYSSFYGPYYYPYYDPFWWGPPHWYPFWGPSFYTAPQGRPMGQVKIESNDRLAQVYIDGAYAGTVQDLKKLWLDPGVYEFELRSEGKQPEQQRVYVLTNKTVKLEFGRAK
jgi:hypothetical protein